MKDEFDNQIDDQDNDRRKSEEPLSDDEIITIAKEKVKGPGIALIVLGVISFCMIGYGVYSYIFQMPGQIADAKKEVEKINAKNGQDPQKEKAISDFMDIYFNTIKVAAPIFWVLNGVIAIVTIMAGVKLKNLESPGLVKTGSILSMIPCLSGCCLLGIPFGIWTIVTMGNVDVKEGFAIMKRRKSLAQ